VTDDWLAQAKNRSAQIELAAGSPLARRSQREEGNHEKARSDRNIGRFSGAACHAVGRPADDRTNGGRLVAGVCGYRAAAVLAIACRDAAALRARGCER